MSTSARSQNEGNVTEDSLNVKCCCAGECEKWMGLATSFFHMALECHMCGCWLLLLLLLILMILLQMLGHVCLPRLLLL